MATLVAADNLLSAPVIAAREGITYASAYARLLRGDWGHPVRIGSRWYARVSA